MVWESFGDILVIIRTYYLKEISVFIHVFVLFRLNRINGNQIFNYKTIKYSVCSQNNFFPISLKNTTKMIKKKKNAEIGLCLINNIDFEKKINPSNWFVEVP